MIPQEEFKSEYREAIQLQFNAYNVPDGQHLTVEYLFEFANQDDALETVLNEENTFATLIDTFFGLSYSNTQARLNISLGDGKALLPRIGVTPQQLIKAPGHTLTFNLTTKDGITILVQVTLVIPHASFLMYSLQVACIDLPLVASGLFGSSDPFIRILKKNPGFGTLVQVYESEVIRSQPNPVFKPIRLSAHRLCNSSRSMTQTIITEKSLYRSGITPKEEAILLLESLKLTSLACKTCSIIKLRST